MAYTVSGLDDHDILARTAVAPDSLLASVRREIWAVDSNVAVAEAGALKALLKESSFTEPQFDLIATGAFAGIGLALVVIGVFSITAYTVSLQTHEVGVRMALVTSQANVLIMVLKKGIVLIAAGVVIELIARRCPQSFAGNAAFAMRCCFATVAGGAGGCKSRA